MNIKLREPANSITHIVALFLAVIASMPLIIKADVSGNPNTIIAICIYAISMILLYFASSIYHGIISTPEIIKKFRKFDHMMIFVLIAGTYTPICMIVLDDKQGLIMLIIIWSIAIAGMLMKLLWITCPKWVSSVLYISMGWASIGMFKSLWNNLGKVPFMWLLSGGIAYTIGGVIYAFKFARFDKRFKNFGIHAIFHLFIIAGSLCHYILIYRHIA